MLYMHTRYTISFDIPKLSINCILLNIGVRYYVLQIKLTKNDLIYIRELVIRSERDWR